MKIHPQISASILVACALTLAGRAAFAQTSSARARTNDQHVVFDDELLNADLSAPFGANVFGAHLPPARTLLLRPRFHFVPELLLSVEQL